MSLISVLKRRNVHRMAAGYVAASWLLLQVVETLLPVFGFSENAVRNTVIMLAIGFIPALAVSWAFEWTPQGLVRDTRTAPGPAVRAHAKKTWDLVILVVLAMAVGLFAFERFVLTPQREAALIEAATEAGIEMGRSEASVIPDESVAVLPFTNMSADPDNEYFSDGLTETLLHMLAQLNDLKVAARTSSFAFKGKNEDIRTIAEALSVAHVLEGSVQRASNRIRVTAQLIRAADGYHLWSQNYDRDLDDVFAIQDEIATDVAIALGSTLLASNSDAIVGVATEDVRAYDLYLQGLEQLLISTDVSILEADRLFNEALARDPSFIEAKVALVRAFMEQSFKGTLQYEEAMPEAEKLIAEVLANQPDNLAARQIEAILVIDRTVWDQMDMTAIDRQLEELLRLFDEGYGHPWARRIAAGNLAAQERHEEALNLLRQGLVVDPLNFDLLWSHSGVLQDLGRFDEALVPLMTAMTIEPDNSLVYYSIGNLERLRGRFAEALPYMRQHALMDTTSPYPPRFLADLFNNAGLYEEADRWRNVFRSRNPTELDLISDELFTAIGRDDEATIRSVVTDALDRSLKGELDQDLLGPLAQRFAFLSHEDGKSQEAIDYLESYYPGISDFRNFQPANWLEFRLQYYGVLSLMLDVLDEEGDRQLLEDSIANARKFGANYEDFDGFYLGIQYLLYGHDAGKAAFVERYADVKPVFHFHWQELLESPWLAELREDPEVAAVVAAREERIAEIREELRAVIEQPEWRDNTY